MSSIETRPNSSILRRLSRGQFGLRFLLALMVVAAIGAWWYVQLPEGTITERLVQKVHNSMSESDIRSLLGKPNYIWKSTWEYDIVNHKPDLTDAEVLIVEFYDGKVTDVRRSSKYRM